MGSKLKYLIIDDDIMDTFIIWRELADKGFDIEYTHVDNELDMKRALITDSFDIIISDHNMPCFSSIEALLIRNYLEPKMPFIILTAYIPENIAEEALLLGCNAIVPKDDIERLPDMISKMLVELDNGQVIS